MRVSRLAIAVVAPLAILVLALAGWALGQSPSQAQNSTMHNCPQPGKWAIAVWSGDDGTEVDQAFAICGESAVAAAYRIDPDTQAWSRYFHGRPEISNLATLDDGQGVIALGAGVSAASTVGGPPRAAANGMLGCPQTGKWAISVWTGASGTPTDQALASCTAATVAVAYWIDPQTQAWRRYFDGRPDISNLATLDQMQGIITLGGEQGEVKVCPGGDRAAVLLVDPSLLSGIRSSLDQFETDLCSEGYTVIETRSDFTVPPDVRAYLAKLYAQTEEHLVGAILVGDLPHAYQWITATWTNPDIPPLSEEVISFQYYADLDGVFEASPGYTSPAGHPYSYDVHRGDVDWEIWIGVLPVYRGDPASTVEAINRYFAKNHAYRAGEYDLPRSFLQVNEHFRATTQEEHNFFLNELRSGQYAWTPFSNAPNARLYFDSPPGGLSVDQGYADLSAGVADFTVVDAHGYWGASGKLDIAWVETNPVGTAFFWSNGCAVGDLDHVDNFLTSVLYSPTSMVVVAKGTTNDSGGMGTNEEGFFGHNVATALSLGESFGQAMLSHVNVPLLYPWSDSRELHFATPVILGDPTLRLEL